MKYSTVIGFSAMIFLFSVSGCKKNISTLEQQEPAPEPVAQADTNFVEPEPFKDVDTSDNVVFEEADLDAKLDSLVKQKLTPVYFEYNSFTLTDESVNHLADVATFLTEHPNLRILIEGHCDERGSSEYNMGLGENRAKAVKNFLKNYGIPSLQMEITSWGKEKPAVLGCFDEICHSKNRRAEFVVLGR